jgi:hypothetical protein
MARYIDMDKLAERIPVERDGGESLISIGDLRLALRLAEAETGDVVEVVRCRDCKHKNPNCYRCLRDNLWHDEDDFCSRGERREQT